MMELDHIAVSATTLSEGHAHVEEALGLRLQPGGQHAHYGTHNLLLGLEDGLYLEVISIDPSAPKPSYPRWFDLDRFQGNPRITNWICRVNDLQKAVGTLPAVGQPVALARGDLRWQMAVPESGVLPFGGLFPALIEWSGHAHPTQRLDASGCRLLRLTVTGPDTAGLKQLLRTEIQDDRLAFEAGATGFVAEFDTPAGRRVLT